MKLVQAAMAKASEMNVPQCICVVDAGGHLLAFARMDGAFALSVDTALRKAQTAASYGGPTGDIAAGIDLKLAIATAASARAPANRTRRWRGPRLPRCRAPSVSSGDASRLIVNRE
jgi:uncharacterized protein GlcG (DUF336 family)